MILRNTADYLPLFLEKTPPDLMERFFLSVSGPFFRIVYHNRRPGFG